MNETLYSVWLIPENKAEIRKIITNLSNIFKTPTFEPHITLVENLAGKRRLHITKFSQLANSAKSFKLRMKTLMAGQDYFKCLYISIEQSPDLQRLRDAALRIFAANPPKIYDPHMSLLYGNLSNEELSKVFSDMRKMRLTSFKLEGMWLVDTTGPPENWRKIKSQSL